MRNKGRKKKNKRGKKKQSNPRVLVENEFTWMVEQNRCLDKLMNKINKTLKNESLNSVICRTENTLYNRIHHRSDLAGWTQYRSSEFMDKQQIEIEHKIHTSKIRLKILKIMYEEQYNNMSMIKRLFTKKRKWKYE
jgi:hypothetical protein